MKDKERQVFAIRGHLGARRLLWRGLALAAIATLSFALLSAPAYAGTVTTHTFLSSFDGSATPAGSFDGVGGVAVDESSGHVYVIDEKHATVDVFDSAGSYLFELSDPPGAFSPSTIAVDNSGGPADGNVYVGNEIEPRLVNVFDSSGAFRYQIASTDGGQIEYITGLSIGPAGKLYLTEGVGYGGDVFVYDTSASSATYSSTIPVPDFFVQRLAADAAGNVYLGNRDNPGVTKYDPAGAVIGTLGSITAHPEIAVDLASNNLFLADDSEVIEHAPSGAVLTRFGGNLTATAGVAVDSAGERVYVADPAANRVAVFGPTVATATPDVALGAHSPSYFSAVLNGTINPAGVPAKYRFEYKPKSESRWSFTAFQNAGGGSSAVPAGATAAPLRHGTTYDVRLVGVATESGAISRSAIGSFATPTVPPPAIAPVTAITAAGATFSGSVNPQGTPVGWHFEYSADGASWTSVPASDQSAGSGTGDVPVSTDATGLEPHTTYRVRLVASYDGGKGGQAVSAETTFATDAVPPTIPLLGTWRVQDTFAGLRALVNPRNAATTYHLEYGTDTGYGTSVPASQDGSAGAGGVGAFVGQDVSGLQPQTTYHWRLVAENVGGVTVSPDQTFTTHSSAEVALPSRGIELVNNPDKGGQSAGRAFLNRAGDAVTYLTDGGAPGSPVGFGIFRATRTLTTPHGWLATSLIPSIDQLTPQARYEFAPKMGTPDGHGAILAARLTEDATVERLDPSGNLTVLHKFTYGSLERTMLEGSVPRGFDASEDLSHVFVNTRDAIDPDHVGGTYDIYDIGSGSPQLISRLPDGSVPTCGVGDSGFSLYFTYSGRGELWVSADGSRILFQSPGDDCGANPSLFLRDLETGTTTQLSGPPQPGGITNSVADLRAFPVRMARDGSSVVFITNTKPDPSDGNSATDVYLWTDADGSKCLTCAADVAVESAVASEDLSHVYFTSRDQLAPGVGEQLPPFGPTNLYVWSAGEVRYVSPFAATTPGELWATQTTMQTTPNGEVAIYRAAASGVTADDPGSCGAATPCQQLYRYDDRSDEIACLSCPPLGVSADDGRGDNSTSIPFSHFPATTITDDGSTVLFTADLALLARDINDGADVYEWHNGRVALVTDGATEFPENTLTLYGISPSRGTDVYFGAGKALTGFELDRVGQLYDARAGGGFTPPNPPAPCAEDSCQGPLVAPPPLSSAGSASFAGPPSPAAKTGKARRCAGKQARKARGQKARCARKGAQKRHGGKREKASTRRQG